jgi:hypothetical protein
MVDASMQDSSLFFRPSVDDAVKLFVLVMAKSQILAGEDLKLMPSTAQPEGHPQNC